MAGLYNRAVSRDNHTSLLHIRQQRRAFVIKVQLPMPRWFDQKINTPDERSKEPLFPSALYLSPCVYACNVCRFLLLSSQGKKIFPKAWEKINLKKKKVHSFKELQKLMILCLLGRSLSFWGLIQKNEVRSPNLHSKGVGVSRP